MRALLVIAVLGLVGCGPDAEVPGNLVENGSFERGLDGWAGGSSWQANAPGRQSWRAMRSTADDTEGGSILSESFLVVGGREYELRAAWRFVGGSSPGLPGTDGISLLYWDVGGRLLSSIRLDVRACDTEWCDGAVRAVLPTDASTARVGVAKYPLGERYEMAVDDVIALAL